MARVWGKIDLVERGEHADGGRLSAEKGGELAEKS